MTALSSNTTSESAGLSSVPDLLQQLVESRCVGCLSIQSGSVEWEIALQAGRQIFATHSLEPIEKFDRHLQRLSFRQPRLTFELREQAKRTLSNNLKTLSQVEAECSLIQWLLEKGSIDARDAAELCRQLTLESLESGLLLTNFSHQFLKVELANQDLNWPTLEEMLESCKARIQAWQWLAPEITSPYQRPCLLEPWEPLAVEQYQLFGNLLSGLSLRQLSGVLNQEDLQIAQHLKPLIQAGKVELLQPQRPFDQLPTFQALPDLPAHQQSPEAAMHQGISSTPPTLGQWKKLGGIARKATWVTWASVGIVGAIALTGVLFNSFIPNFTSRWQQSDDPKLNEYQSMIQRNPKDLYALVMLNNLYVGRGQYSQALPIIKQIIELQPNNLNWQITLARVYDLAGQSSSAEPIYDQVLTQNEQSFEALLGKARLRQKQGDQDTAKRFFQQAVQAAPSDQLQQEVRSEMSRINLH